MTKKFFQWALLLSAFFAALSILVEGRGGGIIAIGENAVYLELEACTINMPRDRSLLHIEKDFCACYGFHTMAIDTLTSSTSTAPSVLDRASICDELKKIETGTTSLPKRTFP